MEEVCNLLCIGSRCLSWGMNWFSTEFHSIAVALQVLTEMRISVFYFITLLKNFSPSFKSEGGS